MASNFAAPRGTQDILPPASAQWSALEARIRALAEQFGYAEIRTPIFESTALFARGVGEATDIVEKEMYTFVDRGGREITLRPEFTAPVVRAVLEGNLLAAGPLRLFYLGPIFRYERPQKGRYRQAHQFGVECFGFEGPEADLEVIALAWSLVRAYGIDDARIVLNSIGDAACRPRYRAALLEHFRPHAATLSEESQRRLERNPLRVLDSKDPRDAALVASAPALESTLCDGCRAHFDAVRGYLDLLGIPYVVDPSMVRGLDYYERTVFEITSGILGAQSSVCGGGRYDGLVASLGGPPTPAVGFALGIERFLLMVAACAPPAPPARSGYQAIALGAQARSRLVPIVARLRDAYGRAAFMDYGDRRVKAQFKIADRNGARYALILGTDELERGELVRRDLVDRTEQRLPLAGDVAAAIVEAER